MTAPITVRGPAVPAVPSLDSGTRYPRTAEAIDAKLLAIRLFSAAPGARAAVGRRPGFRARYGAPAAEAIRTHVATLVGGDAP